MKLWLIYDKFEAARNERCIGFYKRECEKYGIDMTLVLIEEPLPSIFPDVAIVRVMAYNLSKMLEENGVKVYNNSMISRIANDKWETYLFMKSHGVKMPKTWIIDDETKKEFPLVAKPVGGKGGRDVCLIHNEEELLQYRKAHSEKAILQECVSDLGKDLRVYVIGGEIIASMLRVSKSDFRSNFCLGGEAVIYNLSKEEEAEVGRISSLFDIGYVGIDFIFDNGRIIFNEMEDVVGARMLYTHTDVDPIAMYIKHIVDKFTH